MCELYLHFKTTQSERPGNQNISHKLTCLHCKIQFYTRNNGEILICKQKNTKCKSSLPKSSVEVDTSFLSVVLFLSSIAFPLADAFRSLDCKSFFSVPENDNEIGQIFQA